MSKKLKKIISVGLLGVLSLTSTASLASTNVISENIDLDTYNINVFKNEESKTTDELFDEAKQISLEESAKPKKDKNGNEIYEVDKSVATYKNDKGQTMEQRETTSFYKVEDPLQINARASQEDGKWDTSSSAYIHSTVSYDRVVYQGKNCVKITKVTGGVSRFSYPIIISNITVTMGQVNSFAGVRNQVRTVDFGSAVSYTMYPSSSWVPVPSTFGSYGSLVGANTQIKFVRGNSKWSDNFVNNLR